MDKLDINPPAGGQPGRSRRRRPLRVAIMLQARMQEKMQQMLSATSDSALTASELRRKYDDPNGPATPRTSAAAAERRLSVAPRNAAAMTRCWACCTALRDPGASYFSCGACGALNGVEPRISSAFAGCCLRGMCRNLSKHGRKTSAVVTLLIASVIIEGVQHLLPYLVSPDFAWSGATVRHVCLAIYLSVGTVFNYCAASLAGPGYVISECCPLRLGTASSEEDNAPTGGRSAPAASEMSSLQRLTLAHGELPLRG